MNLEFTKKCNAKCSFCQYWQLEEKEELKDFSPIIKKFRPVALSISGGEPLMRKDYAQLIKGVRPYVHYISLITNGALLNEESARKLVEAGVDHISVSLDYLSEKHDQVRQVKGLYKHISTIVPKLAGQGYRLSLNTIIMESNLDEILDIAKKAKEWGASVSFSAFCTLKIDDDKEMVRSQKLNKLRQVIKDLKLLKRTLKNIRNSDYYLDQVPEYFTKGHVHGCKAGYRWVHVTPDGYIQPCSELPRICNYDEYSRDILTPTACSKCWYTCRGEAEASHLNPRRFWELINA
ncbi:MAG: radical SAM protein [Pseudomonadota bacterium]